jgi:hypothetical protein
MSFYFSRAEFRLYLLLSCGKYDNPPKEADLSAAGGRHAVARRVSSARRHIDVRGARSNPGAYRDQLLAIRAESLLTTQFESIAVQRLDVRLAQFLLSALGSRRVPPGKRVPLELGFSQSELSQLLGASRPKVNAAIASLERAGAVGRTLDRLFCDPEKLARIVGRQSDT